MCGIVGILAVRPEDALHPILAMTKALAHRGPDGQEVWHDPSAHLALGHTRLAILDLSPTGVQPMVSASSRFVITYNGELYNAAELKAELPGHVWRGTSDTEVFLEHAERFGLTDTLEKSNGMFALALWDREDRSLILARDRFGIKPLTWSWRPGLFLFGSELKAIEAHPSFSPSLDMVALDAFLRRSCVPAPATIWREARKLPPGHWLRIYDDATSEPVLRSWWNPRERAMRGMELACRADVGRRLEELEVLLDDSVRRQLVADVPVGAFLSGGIDSSVVTSSICAAGRTGLKTFTIGLSESGYDESGEAARIAAHFKTEHHQLTVSAQDALAVVPELAQLYDEPFADSSQIPTLLLSRFARSKEVKVVLSGDGGDELFAGYNRHLIASWLPLMERFPLALRRFAPRLAEALPPALCDGLGKATGWRQAAEKTQKFALAVAMAHDFQSLYACLTAQGLEPGESLLVAPPSSPYVALPDYLSNFDPVSRMQLADTISYLPDDVLVKLDRASMSTGLEARVPLLDHRLFELSWSLPPALKIAHCQGKIALRRLLAKRLPENMFNSMRKNGFAIPLDSWLAGPLRPWAEDMLSPSRLNGFEGLDAPLIRKLWNEHVDGKRKRHHTLWNLLMLLSWFDARKAP